MSAATKILRLVCEWSQDLILLKSKYFTPRTFKYTSTLMMETEELSETMLPNLTLTLLTASRKLQILHVLRPCHSSSG
jgi:hypothetical protein